jgi:long-chain acyl-CoA synthetase
MIRVLPQLFAENARQLEEKVFFYHFDGGWQEFTYGQVLSRVRSIAAFLLQCDIAKGERIAILSENRPEWCMAYLGISFAGCIAVPLDAQFGPGEIRILLEDSGAVFVFHSAETAPALAEALQGIPSGSEVATCAFDSGKFSEICSMQPPEDYPHLNEDDIASLIYTSGTTGAPKGVLLSHGNFCSDAEALLKIGIFEPEDNLIAVLPFHHTYPFMGNFILPLAAGLTITFPVSLKGPELLTTIREKRVTVLVGVPQLLELIRNGIVNKMKQLPGPLPAITVSLMRFCGRIRRSTGKNLGRVVFGSAQRALGKQFRFFTSGGAKLDPEVMTDLEAIGFTVLEGYGLTETSPVVTFHSPFLERKAGSIGRQLPSVTIKVVDPGTGADLQALQEGEIVVRGPMVMKGYYKNPEATERVLREGWFHTGDLGFIDSDGYIFVTGRLKEVIVLSSGKNIYPDEVEKKYQQIPLIKELCVIGQGKKGFADSLHAVIVPDLEHARREGIANLQDALKWELEKVSLGMPPSMRLKGYTLHSDPLPRTPLGKLRRFMVKDLMREKTHKVTPAQEEDTPLMRDDVGKRVAECIRPLLKEKIPVRARDNLELDLGLDSLARIELVVSLEKTFGISLPDTFITSIQTVGELTEKIRESGSISAPGEERTSDWSQILSAPAAADAGDIGERSFSERLVVYLSLILIRIIFRVFFRLEGKGLEHVPEEGYYIIAPNHVSYLDAFAVAAVLPFRKIDTLYSIGMSKYFKGRLGRLFAKLANVIPVDERYPSRALQSSALILHKGKSLLVFPEGGRSYDGRLMQFKKGVGILAKELGAPLIPAYVSGTFEALPRGSVLPKFKKIRVRFGPALIPNAIDLSPKPDGQDDYEFLTLQLRERVLDLKEAE